MRYSKWYSNEEEAWDRRDAAEYEAGVIPIPFMAGEFVVEFHTLTRDASPADGDYCYYFPGVDDELTPVRPVNLDFFSKFVSPQDYESVSEDGGCFIFASEPTDVDEIEQYNLEVLSEGPYYGSR